MSRNGIIYKVETKEPGVPKVELVKVIEQDKETITVEAINDGYTFSYDKKYFKENAKEATKEEIENYKLELNYEEDEVL